MLIVKDIDGFIFSLSGFGIKYTRSLLHFEKKISDTKDRLYQRIKPDLIEEINKNFYNQVH